MKTQITLLVAIFALGCNKNSDVDVKKIEVGMSAIEVITLVGEPDEKIELLNTDEGSIQMWHYSDDVLQFEDGKVAKSAREVEADSETVHKLIEE